MYEQMFSDEFITSRLLDYLHNKSSFPRIILSIMLFGAPTYVIAGIVFWLTGISELLSYGFLLAFFWLAIAPYAIWKGMRAAKLFFERLGTVVKDKKNFIFFVREYEHVVFSVRAYLCGIPFILGADYLVFILFPNTPLLIQLIMSIILTVLFFVAGIGFWGVITLIRLTQRLKQLDVDINPFHPDKFGGLGFVGSLAIKITLCFSTGSLVIPLGLEATMNLPSYTSASIALVLTITYVFMIIVSFAVPTFAIHSWLLQVQYKYLIPISGKMKRILNEYLLSEKPDKKKELLDVIPVYGIADRMKEWPYDFQVIAELIGSILLPIVVTMLQLYFGF